MDRGGYRPAIMWRMYLLLTGAGKDCSHEEDVLVMDRGGYRPAVMRRMYLLWTGKGASLQS